MSLAPLYATRSKPWAPTSDQRRFLEAWSDLLRRGAGLGVLLAPPGRGKTEAVARAVESAWAVLYLSTKNRVSGGEGLVAATANHVAAIVFDEAQLMTDEGLWFASMLSLSKPVWLVGLPDLAPKLLSLDDGGPMPTTCVGLGPPTKRELVAVRKTLGSTISRSHLLRSDANFRDIARASKR